MRKVRILKIRQFMLIGLLSMIFLPRLFYVITDFITQPILQHESQTQTGLANQVIQEISRNATKWHDPNWQTRLRHKYKSSILAVSVLDPSEKEIFHIGHFQPRWATVQQMTVIEQGHVLGTIQLITFNHSQIFAILSAVLAVLFPLLFIGLQMRRYVLKPLAAMSSAARKIAKGDLNFELPVSRVAEVAEVRTAFHAMGDELRESLIRQAKLEEERRFFITSIAHDLRTPLFALRGYLLGIEQGLADTPEKMARYLTVCRQKSEQLERLVSDLFAYSKIEYMGQTVVVHHEPLAFGSWIKRIVEHFRLLTQAKEVEMVLQEYTEPCLIQGDAHLLERAVENLLDNALRYTPSGGMITVKWHVEGEQVILTITDTGPGIPANDLPHIFDPLYRAEKSRNPETGGTGLGLTIAKRIFNAHQGDLTAANRLGGGAEFTGWFLKER